MKEKEFIISKERYDLLIDILKEEYGASAVLDILKRVNDKLTEGEE